MNINYVSYEELINDCRTLCMKIPNKFDAIIAIPRSGLIPASIISFHFNIPVLTVEEFINGIRKGSGTRLEGQLRIIKNILIIDDSYNLGNAMNSSLDKIKPYCIENNIEYENAVVYASQKNPPINYFLKTKPHPRIFEWNLFNHGYLESACVDIDGVLCNDPIYHETHTNFIEHVVNAKPLHLLGRPALALVTNRLEKYRKETEEWLSKHNIQYQFLLMAEFKTPEDRRNYASMVGYGKMKADRMKEVGGQWFIESSLEQAKQIKHHTGVSVFCTEIMKMI